jgi:16S rRNA (guanine966-N2)-methyltransferase
VKALGLRSRVWVLPLAVKRGLAVLGEKEEAFDLIFMDPPYDKGLVGKTLEEIAGRGIITSTGVIVAEHSPKEEILPPLGMVLSQQRRYGDTSLSFFQEESASS